MTRFGRTITGITLFLCMLAPAGVTAAITASTDRTVLTEDDTLVLLISANDGEELDRANLDPLLRDFEILSSARNSSTTIRNWQRETVTELRLTLSPRRNGQLRVPRLNIDGQQTEAINIVVTAAAQQAQIQQVFIEASVDRKDVYVQSQLLLTVKFFQAVNLTDLQRSDLDIDGARIEELDSQRGQQTINGITYRVTALRFAVFPERSGTLSIPAIAISGREATAQRGFMTGGRALRRRTQPIDINVLPIPSSYPDAPWIASSELDIEESWSPDPNQLETGQSATRTLTITARGTAAAQIPGLSLEEAPGLRLYADQPVSEEIQTDSGITAVSVQSAALLATEAGEFELPELRMPWWNTRTRSVEYAIIPARSVTIKAAAATASAAPEAAPEPPPTVVVRPQIWSANPWFWSTLATATGWLLTVIWLRRGARNVAPAPANKTQTIRKNRSLKDLLPLLQSDDAQAARTALLDWGEAHFGEPLDLRSLGRTMADQNIDTELRALERALYGTATADWSGSTLIQALQDWSTQQPSAKNTSSADALPPLYPLEKP